MDNSWLNQRGRSIHMTVRDVDCGNFDVDAFVEGLKKLNITFYSVFAGGYVSTYPTKLKDQRMSPFLRGRDLLGELIEKSHAAGIKVVAMIDLGQLTREAALRHPDWCMRDKEGNPVRVEDRIYSTCPNSPFRREFCIEMFEEILNNYDIDCVKLGGGSFGFSKEICYCEHCREAYRNETGLELPEARDWNDPAFRRFYQWQCKVTRDMLAFVRKAINDIRPGMPLMGNATCFGDPGWTLNCCLDMEEIANTQDAMQLETQMRERLTNGRMEWQSLTWPAETANFMSHVTDRPSWIVSSYFLAWPWRRSAMSYAEQKIYFAQKMAFGCIPMVNLSGGPMKVHEDQRGLRAIEEVYGYMAEHQAYYDNDKSLAHIGVLYSQETMVNYGNDDAGDRYVKHIRGVEQMLNEEQIPFDLLSIRTFQPSMIDQYDVIILPNMVCMSESDVQKIKDYAAAGGRVIATYKTSLCDEEGNLLSEFQLGDLFNCTFVGDAHVEVDTGLEKGVQMAYMVLDESDKDQGWFENLGDTTVLPAHGMYARVQPTAEDVEIPLVKSATAQVFPEGLSYVRSGGEGWPMMLCSGDGNVIYFPHEIDKSFWEIGYGSLKTVFINAVKSMERRPRPVKAESYPTLLISSRQQEGRRNVHMINLTGGRRCFDVLVPLYNTRIAVPAEGKVTAKLVSDGSELPVSYEDGYAWVTVPCLKDYDIVSFEAN